MTALEQAKLLLGISDTSKDSLLSLCGSIAEQDIRRITKISPLSEIDPLLQSRMIVVIYQKLGSEIIASQNFSGVGESFVLDYPADILNILKSYRKLRTI